MLLSYVLHVPASRPRAGLGGGILMLHLGQHRCYIDVTSMLHRCRGGYINVTLDVNIDVNIIFFVYIVKAYVQHMCNIIICSIYVKVDNVATYGDIYSSNVTFMLYTFW